MMVNFAQLVEPTPSGKPRVIEMGDTSVEHLWRVDSSPEYDSTVIFFTAFRVVRHTQKGVKIDNYGTERFVLNYGRKRFAYPTKAEALNSFIIRKQRQIGHLAAQHDRAVAALAAAETLTEKNDEH